ncbi:MAG: immune inhibitor A [Bdellovibrionales bacterium]|nr:immune inhibitor A [Bdellovibrionales bacterium]
MSKYSFRSSVSVLVLVFSLMASACSSGQGSGENEMRRQRDEANRRALSDRIAVLQAREQSERDASTRAALQEEIRKLEEKLEGKRYANSLAYANHKIISGAMKGHTATYSLKGKYRVMLIPVQFSDVKFEQPEFFAAGPDGGSQAQEYLFGENLNSLRQYYKHASLGQFELEGVVTPVITAPGSLKDYGEAVAGNTDRASRRLVIDALLALKQQKQDSDWWESFDNWDLGDYDSDGHYNEADGFIDAVVLVYAGKSQASCQRDFDPDGKRPASADVPAGPKQASAVECFNRIWPHRWSISVPANDPIFTSDGPMVEGLRRPSMNGLKISDNVFALDYNMQSEFSDRSTFMHEFGHSLTLPDVYAMQGDNSTGAWELMSSNARLQAQELSSYSKISLGWLAPKVVRQGERTSAYVGAYNYVSEGQREDYFTYSGPGVIEEDHDGVTQVHDVVSTTPETEEPVYRSLVAMPRPSVEQVKVVDMNASTQRFAAYTGRYDGGSKSLKLALRVPSEGDATLRFDTIFHIETETNFNSPEAEIKVITDYDIGQVLINGAVREDLRLVSGDSDNDTLADLNPLCEAARALALRTKKHSSEGLTAEELQEFNSLVLTCQAPIWVTKSYDLSDKRGQEVELEIRYVTDAGYTEFGIVVDNVTLGTEKASFETAADRPIGDWKLLTDGKEDVQHSQFYLFEYRTPGENFVREGKLASYNMDNNIEVGTQAYFLRDGANATERFRMTEFKYQPGVLVWYFNSKFDRRSNSASAQDGKGYLLVLNSKVRELKLPGTEGESALFNAAGEYDVESEAFKQLKERQTLAFVCYSHTAFEAYIKGEAPNCADDDFKDAMLGLRGANGLPLMYRRQWFNDLLPVDQYAYQGVGMPLSNDPGIRTGLSTFRPDDAGDFAPLTVYRAEGDRMVMDEVMTAASMKVPPVSSFRDADNALPGSKRFWGDTAVVEKVGFGFKVVSPSKRVIDQYSTGASPDSNSSAFRRPRAKLYFEWH